MKIKYLCLLLLLCSFTTFAQQKRFSIDLNIGAAKNREFVKSDKTVYWGSFYNLQFSYATSKSGKHNISLNLYAGIHKTLDTFDFIQKAFSQPDLFPVPFRIPPEEFEPYQSGTISYRGIGLMYKYRFLQKNKFSAFIGIGLNYDKLFYSSLGASAYYLANTQNVAYNIEIRKLQNASIILPIRLETKYAINKHWSAGLALGAFLNATNDIENIQITPMVAYAF